MLHRLIFALLLLFPLCASAKGLPDVRLQTAEDATVVTLSSLQGRYVLLNFWATWCPPCRKEMAGLLRLQQDYGGANFAVVPISVEAGKRDIVQDYYARYDLSVLPLYVLDDKQDMIRLKILGLPTTILLNPQGEVVWRVAGDLNWDDPELRAKLAADLQAR